MTNLQAMQDERLRELIRDVELLKRLRNALPYCFTNDNKLVTLQEDIEVYSEAVEVRWRELMEEG